MTVMTDPAAQSSTDIATHIYRARNPDGTPVLDPPYPKQREVLWEIFKPPHFTGKPRYINLCCGWGFGKTQLAIDAAQALLDLCPKNDGLFTSCDPGNMETAIHMWETTVPPELYKYVKGEHKVIWLRTGSQLFFDHRNTRGSLAQTLRHFQGKTVAWHIDDEASTECSMTLLNQIDARVRQPGAPILVRLTTSTPRMGEYVELLNQEGSITLHGRTEDNPYLPAEKVAYQRSILSRAQARRDMDGELVALEDQLWPDVDLTHSWPVGNVDDNHPRFNPSYPWFLFCDFGSATGAYAVVQPVTNGIGLGQPRWVIVSDLCPQSSGNVKDAFLKLRAQFGNPAGVAGGIGINQRADTDGATPAFFVAKTWNDYVNIYSAPEDHVSNQIQYETLSALFCAGDGTRRLTIARDMVDQKAQLDKDSKRGVIEMVQQDTWPDDIVMASKMYLPKGPKIRISHIRDALLQGAVTIMAPPEWQKLRHD